MNHRMHLMSEFGLLIGILMLGGTQVSCVLSDLVKYGDDCEGATSVIDPGKNQVLCEPDDESANEECADYQTIMAEGKCPGDYSKCYISSVDPENKFCHNGCSDSQVLCDKQCVTPNDPKYCGARGNCDSSDVKSEDYRGAECTDAQRCKKGKDGVYQCVKVGCGIGTHFDPETSLCELDTNENCGEIGNVCGDEEICSHGYCRESCQTGADGGVKEVECEIKGNKKAICIDPMTNASFCGADDNCKKYSECEGETPICRNGVCISICENEGSTLCKLTNDETLCTDLMSDPEHCGTCFSNCNSLAPKNAEVEECNAGKCIYKCKEGYTDCKSDESELPECYNLNKDNKHCGGCGENDKCAFPLVCKESSCTYSTCDSPTLCEDNSCENSDTQCGLDCLNCKTEGHAVDGYCNEDGECVITKCADDYDLFEGKCLQPGPDYCVADNVSTQPKNCTEIPNAINPGCNTSTGECIVGICKMGYHVYDNTCEENNNEHCGYHDHTCPDGSYGPHVLSYACSESGTCHVEACEDGYKLEDMQCNLCDANLKVFVARHTNVLGTEAVIMPAATVVLHYKQKTEEVDAEGRPRYKVNISFHKEDSQYNEGPDLDHVWVYGDYLNVVTTIKETIILIDNSTELKEGCVDPDVDKARLFNTDTCQGEDLNHCNMYNIYCNGNYYGWVKNSDLDKMEPFVNDLSGVPDC